MAKKVLYMNKQTFEGLNKSDVNDINDVDDNGDGGDDDFYQ